MASRGEELNLRLTATDNASPVVDALDKRLDGLTDDEKRVVLELQAKNAQRELDRINRDLANAQKYDDDEIQLRINAKGDAERRLEAIQSQVRDLDGATPKIEPDVDSSSLDSFIDKLDDLTGGNIGGLGALRGRGPAALGGAIAAAFVLAGDAAADAAIEVDNIAKLTGDTVEDASRLAGIMGRAGVETKDLQDILLQMGGVLADDAELAGRLGVNLDDGKTLGERFVEVVDRLGERFTDTGERSVVASRLFGEEGVRQVNAVTAAYGDLNEAVENYSGSVFTSEDVREARNYQRELAELRDEFKQLRNEVGGQVVPALGDVVTSLNEINTIGGTAGDGGLLGAAFNTSFGAITRYNNAVLGVGKSLLGIKDSNPEVEQSFRNFWLGLTNGTRTAVGQVVDSLEDIPEAAADVADRATTEFEDFVNEVNGLWADALAEANAPLDELRQKLEDEKIFDRLAAQLEKVKAAPGDREETRRLLDLVLDLGAAYADIPRSKIVEIFAQIDRGQVDQAFNELQALANQRAINLQVATGGTSFRINPNGAPTQIQSPTQYSAAPTTVINNYQISPTTGQVVGATSANDFANGSRSSYR